MQVPVRNTEPRNMVMINTSANDGFHLKNRKADPNP